MGKIFSRWGYDNNKIGFSIRLGKCKIVDYCYEDRRGWIRIFGSGFKWKDLRVYDKSFSERYCYTKHIVINKWLIGILK